MKQIAEDEKGCKGTVLRLDRRYLRYQFSQATVDGPYYEDFLRHPFDRFSSCMKSYKDEGKKDVVFEQTEISAFDSTFFSLSPEIRNVIRTLCTVQQTTNTILPPSHALDISKSHHIMSSLDVTPSRVAPRGRDPARGVYYKLAFFSVALFAAPLSAYYFAKDRYFSGTFSNRITVSRQN